MTAADRCPECGGPLLEGKQGMCARCLLAAALPVTAPPPRRLPAPGDCIGSYRIVRLLGEGGMGMVYLAEQDEPIARQVALKVIKLGMDTRAVLARFQSEQQALALMDHPNIAHVYEAGSDAEGRPYFAMEYVCGIPITEYCDAHRLDTRRRLALFLRVADAVQHAHQKGVIHRDLKPSNILVAERDGEPIPKIIDFGLAKATEKRATEETVFTETGLMIGTPEYMSPEQAGGAPDVDTRTDIYSLGVLLYEVLVGAVPFDSRSLRAAGYEEIRRVIRETDPPKPATRLDSLGAAAAEIASRRATDARGLRRELRGDLEWITLKALEKDRSRRYASASDLAEDIRRRLAGKPVAAAPPDAVYRLRKFAARHVLQLAAVAVVFVGLLAGLALSTAYYLRSAYERESIEGRNCVANMAAAARLLNLNHPETAQELLLVCAPEMRGWEWQHLWARSDSGGGGVLRRFQQPIAAMGAALKSGSVAVGFETGAVEVVAPDGTAAERWQAHTGGIRALALAPDGSVLLTAGDEPALRVWDVPSKRLMEELPLPARASSLAYGAGGQRFAAASEDGTALVWRADSRTRLLAVRTNQAVDSVEIIPDGSGLATTGGGSVRLWHMAGGRARHTFQEAALAAFSGNGRFALTAALGKREARVWNARTGELWNVLDTGAEVVSAAFGRGGRIVVATRDGALQIWHEHYPRRILALDGEPGIRSIRFTGDGNRLLGLYSREVRIWDTAAAHTPPNVRTGTHGEAATPVPSLWSLLRKMLAGALFAVLIAGISCAALFRRKQWQSAIDRWLAKIPVGVVPWRAAWAGRWLARILGTLVALFVAAEIMFEMPSITTLDAQERLLLAGFGLMIAGFSIAWIWEAAGGLCALAGYAVFAANTPMFARTIFFRLVAAVGVLHVLCWLRLRAGKAKRVA